MVPPMAWRTGGVPAGLRRSNPLARPISRTRQTSFLALNETLMLASFLTDGFQPVISHRGSAREDRPPLTPAVEGLAAAGTTGAGPRPRTLKVIVPYSRGPVQT